jgi:ssDNA-binding Zn-finger/Zn-ribbon topoisomerase 1
MPMIKCKQPRKGMQELCINPDCPTKSNGKDEHFPEEGMECPVCKEGKMVLRKSFYGHFLGCDRYPKCKTMMKVVDGKVDTTPISAKKTRKKAVKKTDKKSAEK